jgi:hypothetical protein
MPIEPLEASHHIGTTDGDLFDGFASLLPWNKRENSLDDLAVHRRSGRDLEERRFADEGPPQGCAYFTHYPSGDDDDVSSRAANWSTTLHCAGAGLVALPQPLPSDAVYMSVSCISRAHASATSGATTSPRCLKGDLATVSLQENCNARYAFFATNRNRYMLHVPPLWKIACVHESDKAQKLI